MLLKVKISTIRLRIDSKWLSFCPILRVDDIRSVRLKIPFLFIAMFLATFAFSQKRIVQLSGIILGEDSVTGVPGVHVYVPKAGRGTTTNYLGYFSMPTLMGDEVVISAIGYRTQKYVVPNVGRESITLIVELVADTTYLEEVLITPFPTEKLFKEAVLALNLPPDENMVSNEHLNEQLLELMVRSTPMDGQANHRYFLENWQNQQQRRFGPPSNPFLNPFNWAEFLRSLRRKND